MSVYERARRHSFTMLALVFAGLNVIVVADRLFGHSTLAFAAVIAVLIFANVRMMGLECPRCGQNVFFRGGIALPWPRKTCSRCGQDLTQKA